MNRVVKTAVAVTAFGLAAALAVPAQADVQYNSGRYATNDAPLGGTSAPGSPLGGPIGSLLGGLVQKGLLSGLFGKAKSAKAPSRPMTEEELDAASEDQREPGMSGPTPNAAEDAVSGGSPLTELSPIVGGFRLAHGDLTKSLPVLSGASRLATPAVKTGEQGNRRLITEGSAVSGAYGAVTGLVDSSAGGTANRLAPSSLMPGAGAGFLDATGLTAKTMSGAARSVESLSADTALTGLAMAARRALPNAASGELAPIVGQVAPAEMAPVVQSLPGTSQAASVDELTPLVEDASGVVATRGVKTTGYYGDVVAALGWTTDALTGSVRNSWVRD
ncbi:hypothetical protein [Nonomuraea zeae]|uniref:Uncharacterized protein n=1 Tax=Nonomuraea zeae TaxID=1642303 RepID=A0A5S4GB68_9ACTN|nr:hypothetical protein [Nonomuraea zeae]TMR30089.1 hypothetical protein ETD85_30315 [Nonomuraea zeae]